MTSVPPQNTAHARALILQHGWNTTSYQLLNPGFTHWFSPTYDALVGYVSVAGTRVVGGAPVCATELLPAVTAEFECAAARAGERVCYFAAEERLESIYRTSTRHARMRLGAQPMWDPHAWSGLVAGHASVRAQCNRARNKGVVVTQWTSARADHHPALESCLHQWLAQRALPPLHFLIEPDTLGVLDDRAVFVAEHGDTVVGFLVASPIATRHGWLIEQFVRAPHAPNGTVELMLDTAMRWMADIGASYATLGLAPLSTRAGPITTSADPLWLRAALSWVRAHGRRFYNFDGLDAFKAKYRPMAWEPVFAIATEPRISPHTLYAIAAAFTQGRPAAVVARGLVWAVQREWHWLTER